MKSIHILKSKTSDRVIYQGVVDTFVQLIDDAIAKDKCLVEADFSEKDLEYSDFTNVRLSGCCFDRAVLNKSILKLVKCNAATFVNASLIGADLTGGIFIGSDFSGANLENAILAESDFTGAILTNCNLSGTELASVYMGHQSVFLGSVEMSLRDAVRFFNRK